MGFLQRSDQFQILGGILVHGLHELRLCFGDFLNFRRDHVAEVLQTHIALALHAERGNAVPCHLCKKRAGYPFNAKGKAGMLNGAGMAKIRELLQKRGGLFRGQPVQQCFDVRIGIAQLSRGGHCLFGIMGMGDQRNQHGSDLL